MEAVRWIRCVDRDQIQEISTLVLVTMQADRHTQR